MKIQRECPFFVFCYGEFLRKGGWSYARISDSANGNLDEFTHKLRG